MPTHSILALCWAFLFVTAGGCDSQDPVIPNPPDEEDPIDPPPDDDPIDPEAAVLALTTIEAGLLQVNWSAPENEELVGYRVSRRLDAEDSFAVASTINDPSTEHWADPGFVGGTVQYRLEALYPSDTLAVATDWLQYDAPELTLTAHRVTGDVELAWTETPFYGAFASYDLERAFDQAGTPGSFSSLATLTTWTETSFVDSDGPVLGEAGNHYRLRLTSQSGEAVASEEVFARLGYDIPAFGIFTGFSGAEYVAPHRVILSAEGMTLFDFTTRTVLASRSDLRFAYDAQGTDFLVGVPFSNSAFHLLDRETLQTIETVTVNEIIGRSDRTYLAGSVRVGQHGVVGFDSYWYISPAAHFEGSNVYHLDQRRMLARYPQGPTSDAHYFQLAPNAPFLLDAAYNQGAKLYRVSETGLQHIRTLDGSTLFFGDGQRVSRFAGRFYLYDTETNVVQGSFDDILRADVATGLGYVYTSTTLKVVDTESDMEVLFMPIAPGTIRLVDGVILHSAGYAIPLDEAIGG